MKKLILLSIFVIIGNSIIALSTYPGDECIVKTEFIFQSGDVLFPSCHASTIIENGNGLLAAWFGGTAEKNPDVGIWISRYINKKWTKPVEIAGSLLRY